MAVLALESNDRITGSNLLGALVGFGVTPSALEWELSKIELGDYHLHFDATDRHGVRAVAFEMHTGAVHVHGHADENQAVENPASEDHHHEAPDAPVDLTTFPRTRLLLTASGLDEAVLRTALRIFDGFSAQQEPSSGLVGSEGSIAAAHAQRILIEIVCLAAAITQLEVTGVQLLTIPAVDSVIEAVVSEFPVKKIRSEVGPEARQSLGVTPDGTSTVRAWLM